MGRTCCGCLTNRKEYGGCTWDMACSQTICASDPFCCGRRWDDMCVIKANAICSDQPIPKCCECTTATFAPGCINDLECQTEICAADDYCCRRSWDGVCVREAVKKCKAYVNAGAFDPNTNADFLIFGEGSNKKHELIIVIIMYH